MPGGTIVEEPFQKDPNAICKDGAPPTLVCARGFTMNDDGETCEREYKSRSGGGVVLCLSVRFCWSLCLSGVYV